MIESLPRREREVFEILCRMESGTASGVRAALSDPLSDSAVRTMLTRLEAKGLVTRADGLFKPVQSTEAVAQGALRRMVDTFFAGSAANAATALLGMGQRLTPDEAAALEKAIDEALEGKAGARK
ncbi:BlaI/MecI/CopY family transcriptional regulator [Caulobacter sp. NIBR2454]|uniref:BlaI/MecI/CopY family transcriptional regulator n=1 Tax=Caulobacter sp. NIBR2454 TaxID=3015996 RepID=UPI0022B75021|nr:BlaI/MecI/CopY family transcriptional regulator [Caulobacter sp. NIBR2454]